jgi:hypothetical protein
MSNLQILINSYNNNEFSLKDLDILKDLSSSELVDLVNIDDFEIRTYLIKAYFTTYSDDIVSSAQNIKHDIKSILANVWENHMLSENSVNLSKGMIGFSFLNTNLISMLRENISEKNIMSFENQVYEMFLFFNKKIEEERFLFTIFGSSESVFPNKNDLEMLRNIPENSEKLCTKFIEDVFFISTLWKYYLLKAKKENTSEILNLIKTFENKITVAKKVFPSDVYEKLKGVITITEEKSFADILVDSDSPRKAIFEDNTQQSEDKSGKGLETYIKGFRENISSKLPKNTQTVKVEKIKSEKNKKLGILSTNKPQKRGNGRMIISTVCIMLSFVTFFGVVAHKTTKTNGEPIHSAILEGLTATITVNQVGLTEDNNNKSDANKENKKEKK